MVEFDDATERELARRRWRNLMIASMAGHKISPERRGYLEKMRQQLGVSIEEARAIVDEYRHSGGGITLFGDKYQRLQVFRDIISMLLVDGEIDDKGRALLVRIGERLDIDESRLDQYIRQAQAALRGPGALSDSRDSQRLSRRIFRRMVNDQSERDQLLKEFDTLDREKRRDLELQILESIVRTEQQEQESDESVRTRRQRLAYLEDQRCAKLLLEKGVITEPQIRPFREKQERLFQEEGRVVSFITEMVKSGALDMGTVDLLRRQVRSTHADEQEPDLSWKRTAESDMGGLVIVGEKLTLDHTFRVTCLTLRGFLDHSTSQLLQEVFDEVMDGHDDSSRLLILDMHGLSYISSAGVGAILNARATVLDNWGDIRFVNVSPEAQEIFSLIGVDQVFTFCSSVDAALWSFTELATAKDL